MFLATDIVIYQNIAERLSGCSDDNKNSIATLNTRRASVTFHTCNFIATLGTSVNTRSLNGITSRY
jgi:hypothetical protein